MVFPDVVEAVDRVSAHGSGEVTATTDGVWVADSCQVVSDSENVIRRNADLTV